MHVLKQPHDEGSHSHAVGGELRALSDFGDQTVEDLGGWTCSSLWTYNNKCQAIVKFSVSVQTDSGCESWLCLPSLVETSTTLQEWLRRWPMMTSSL